MTFIMKAKRHLRLIVIAVLTMTAFMLLTRTLLGVNQSAGKLVFDEKERSYEAAALSGTAPIMEPKSGEHFGNANQLKDDGAADPVDSRDVKHFDDLQDLSLKLRQQEQLSEQKVINHLPKAQEQLVGYGDSSEVKIYKADEAIRMNDIRNISVILTGTADKTVQVKTNEDVNKEAQIVQINEANPERNMDALSDPNKNENIDDTADQSKEQLEDSDEEAEPIAIIQPTETDLPLKDFLGCKDHQLSLTKLQYGSYWLLRNLVVGSTSRNVGCADTLTYTTNGDYTFFENLPMLVMRWAAPISFAVFAPGYDMKAVMDSIQHVRQCLPESPQIREFVTFHVYFPAKHMPKSVPLTEKDALAWPYNCTAAVAPYENVTHANMYRSTKNLTYPINVGRNIARKAANTHFIFACDIELMPTRNLPAMFLEMVERKRSLFDVDDNHLRRVFVLPVFEVAKDARLPETKSELVTMLGTKKAVPFHAKLCRYCHQVPEQETWIKEADADELSIFTVSKRLGRHVYWEPFYISDNTEPMFDERVTWEGQSNKRIQGYAMCLLDYDYNILHPAFLVHTPGIKRYNSHSPRLKFVPPMNALIKSTIQPEYRVLYGKNPQCKT